MGGLSAPRNDGAIAVLLAVMFLAGMTLGGVLSRITGMLLKRGYLWPHERDDLTALRQAVILFIRDTIRKTPKPNRKTEDKEIVRTRPCAY
jgi:hypothetical protein